MQAAALLSPTCRRCQRQTLPPAVTPLRLCDSESHCHCCSSLVALAFGSVQALSRADIAPALEQLKKKLMERNVAEEIADK